MVVRSGVRYIHIAPAPGNAQPVSTANVLITPPGVSTLAVAAGATLQLAATATDFFGHALSTAGLVYASSNPAVATVSATGLVTGVARGNCTISASLAGVIQSVTLVVGSLDMSTTKVILVGDSFTFGQGASAGKGFAARTIAAITALGGSGVSFGYSGRDAAYGVTQFDTDPGPQFDLTKTNYIFFEFGPNDLCNVNIASGQLLGDVYFKGLLQLIGKALAKRAAGYSVVIGLLTPPDRDDALAQTAGYRAAKVMAQAFLRENYRAMGADILVDSAAFWRIGADGAADQTQTFNVDAVHPTDLGHFLLYIRVLGAMYEYLGLTLPTGAAATNLATVFEPGVSAKGLGTYFPALITRQALTTDPIQNPPGGWAHWVEGEQSIHLGPMDLPFTSNQGFSLTQWVYLTAADLAALGQRRALSAIASPSVMFMSAIQNSGKYVFVVYYGANFSNFDQITTPGAMTAGIHTLGVRFDPTQARGSRLTLYVDGVPVAGPSLQQGGADGVIARPVGTWGEDVVIGTDLFGSGGGNNFALDYHQALSLLAASGALTDAQMLAQHQYLTSRWLPSVA